MSLTVVPRSIALVALLPLLTLASCSDDTESADRGDCPTDPVTVVVSVDQWGDIVGELGGDCATVTTVITGSSADPHDYEPSPADLAAFDDAQLVVINGLDYDHWAADAVEALDEQPAVVDAGEIVGGSDGDNPHIWYSPTAVAAVVDAVDEALHDLAPGAADYLDEQRGAWDADVAAYDEAITAARAVADGRTFAATESVFDEMADAIGLVNATPEGYQQSAANESEPSPGDLAAFEAALTSGAVDVLIYNSQTEGSGPEQLRDAAEEAGVPVVEVTETVPPGADSFVGWQVDQLKELQSALTP